MLGCWLPIRNYDHGVENNCHFCHYDMSHVADTIFAAEIVLFHGDVAIPSTITKIGTRCVQSNFGGTQSHFFQAQYCIVDAILTRFQFNNIFAVVLPGRQDRAAPLLAAGNATGLNITIVDGVLDDDVPDSEVPPVSSSVPNDWSCKALIY